MTISLQKTIVYGSVHYRRLGHSLGINLFGTKVKLCSFNCVYCQYGCLRMLRISHVGIFPKGITGLAVVDAGADDWKKKKEEKHGTS